MSSNRRKPTPQPRPTPSRRPKVAGLRKPGSTEDAEAAESAETVEPAESADAPAADEAGSPERDEAAVSEPEDETGAVGDRDADGAAAEPARSGPRRKPKDGGRAKPESLDEGETLEADEPGTPAVAARKGRDGKKKDKPRRKPGYAAVAVLLVVGLLLAGAAVFFQIRGSEARAATSNAALVDAPRTSEVKEAMGKAAERLFSIDHNNLGKTEKAANELLAGGEVKKKYDALMGEIKRLAPEQKIVVTVHAARSAVLNLDDDRARVMVFIDQSATRPSDKQPAVGGAAMWLETQKQGDTWKVTNLDTYAAQQPTPAPGQQGGQNGGQQGGQNGGQQGGQQGGQNGGQNGGQQGGQNGGGN